jgi:hypothetical protein
MRRSRKRAPDGTGSGALTVVVDSDRTNDREVVVMSQSCKPGRARGWALPRLLGLIVLAPSLAGCASVSQDVDAYYRQMAYNYKEAGENAKLKAVTLESESKVLAATGDFSRIRKNQREISRVKSWEARCEKEANRFRKAAEWTESHFHVTRPPIPDGPASLGTETDQAVRQASGAANP